jgi:hypothetical protein
MTTTKYDVPEEVRAAVTRARESLDQIIPFAAEGRIGLAFTHIDTVFEQLTDAAGIIHGSKDAAPAEFFRQHYSANYVLKVLRNDQFFERVAEPATDSEPGNRV